MLIVVLFCCAKACHEMSCREDAVKELHLAVPQALELCK